VLQRLVESAAATGRQLGQAVVALGPARVILAEPLVEPEDPAKERVRLLLVASLLQLGDEAEGHFDIAGQEGEAELRFLQRLLDPALRHEGPGAEEMDLTLEVPVVEPDPKR
jgi:hypothetical protein